MKLINLFWEIIKDQRGLFGIDDTLLGGAALMGGSTLLGSLGGKKKTEIIDPYAGLRKQYQDYLGSKLGTSTPYVQNPAFNLDQPEVEKSAESTILGRLSNLPKTEDYRAKIEAAKASQIAGEKTRAEDQLNQERDMYNRLGLSSSTPFLSRAGELGNESMQRQNDISSNMDIYGLNYGLQSDDLVNSIAKDWTGLGTVLGGQQTGRQQYSQQMSMEDLKRLLTEQMGYSGAASGLLSSNPPTTIRTPNLMQNLAGTGQDIGSLLMMSSLLKE